MTELRFLAQKFSLTNYLHVIWSKLDKKTCQTDFPRHWNFFGAFLLSFESRLKKLSNYMSLTQSHDYLWYLILCGKKNKRHPITKSPAFSIVGTKIQQFSNIKAELLIETKQKSTGHMLQQINFRISQHDKNKLLKSKVKLFSNVTFAWKYISTKKLGCKHSSTCFSPSLPKPVLLVFFLTSGRQNVTAFRLRPERSN